MRRRQRKKESQQNALDQGVEAIATQIVHILQQGAIDEDNAEMRRFARLTKKLQAFEKSLPRSYQDQP